MILVFDDDSKRIQEALKVLLQDQSQTIFQKKKDQFQTKDLRSLWNFLGFEVTKLKSRIRLS